jgi:hypothetical protein
MRIYHFDSTTNLVGGVGEPLAWVLVEKAMVETMLWGATVATEST